MADSHHGGHQRSFWALTLTVALAHALFLIVLLALQGGDPSRLVNAGDAHVDPALAPPGLFVYPNADGYDGQFYYRLALDPFTALRTDYGITLDLPAYRQQRILYPLLSWLLSLGRAEWVSATMVLINLGALGAIAWLGAHTFASIGRSPLWGGVLPLYPGYLFTLSADLTEVLEICLLLAGLLLLHQRKGVLAGLFLAAAVLTRETALLMPTAAGLVWLALALRGRAVDRPPWQCWVVPILAYAAVQTLLRWRWGEFPVEVGAGNIGPPLAGPASLLGGLWPLETTGQRVLLLEVGFVAVFILAGAWALRSSVADPSIKLAWVLYAGLAAVGSDFIWSSDWSFWRALSELYALGAIVLVGSAVRTAALLMGWSAGLWLLAAARLIWLAMLGPVSS